MENIGQVKRGQDQKNKFSVELQGKKQFVDETNRKADLNS
jgi:hypothetical protein